MIVALNKLEGGEIHLPESLDVLKKTFRDFDSLLSDIDHILAPVAKTLNDMIPLLEFSGDLNTAINELKETVIAIEVSTGVLIAVPIVGEVVAGVDEAIDTVLEVVTDAQEAILVPTNEFCMPIEHAIKELVVPIQKIDAAVVSLKSMITKWGTAIDVIQEALALAAGIGNAFNAAGKAEVALVFGKLVNAYNTVVDEINKPLGIVNTAMEDIDKVLKPLGDAMSKLQTGTFDKISNGVATVDKTLTTLNPIHELLSHIEVVLKPFEWVLTKGEEIIEKVLGPVLKPFIQPLERSILGVVGLPPDFLDSLKDALKDSTSSSTTTHGSGTVVNNQLLVENNIKSLENTMTNFVSGDINTICANLLKIIQNPPKNN